jgi:hypothetical protein
MQAAADELQQLQADTRSRAERLQEQLRAVEGELASVRSLLGTAEVQAAEARLLRIRVAELEDSSLRLQREVWGLWCKWDGWYAALDSEEVVRGPTCGAA